jgi:hypothetical protein
MNTKIFSSREWRRLIGESPLDWLLEPSNPSVRFFALRDILGRGEDDEELADARSSIPTSPVVAKIMAKQRPQGHWEGAESPYLPKYKASYWQIMILSELGMDKGDERVRRACEYIFRFQHSEGGFSCASLEQARERYRSGIGAKPFTTRDERFAAFVREQQLSCLTGNISAALIRMGYGDDARMLKALRWLARVQNRDGGWLCPYWSAHARDTHGCFGGTIGALDPFSQMPRGKLTGEMERAVRDGAEFLLMHRLYKADHHNYRIINRSWLKFGFPPFYGGSMLRSLDILTKLGYVDDERMSDAVQVLLSKRRKDGTWTWVLEATPAGRMQANIEVKGQPSKWVTLISLRVLKRLRQG